MWRKRNNSEKKDTVEIELAALTNKVDQALKSELRIIKEVPKSKKDKRDSKKHSTTSIYSAGDLVRSSTYEL